VVCVSRTNIDIDDASAADVMRTYRFAAKREAVSFAP
jgi:Arc/MetJ family transcription regulator